MLYASIVRYAYGMLYARKPRSLPFSLASLISEVRSVLALGRLLDERLEVDDVSSLLRNI